VHRKQWTPTQWEEFERLFVEHLETLTVEDLQAYECSMQEWLEGAKAMARAWQRTGMT